MASYDIHLSSSKRGKATAHLTSLIDVNSA